MYFSQGIRVPMNFQTYCLTEGGEKYLDYKLSFLKYRDILLYFFTHFNIAHFDELASVPSAALIECLKKTSIPDRSKISGAAFNALEVQALRQTMVLKERIRSFYSSVSNVTILPEETWKC